MIRIIKQSEIPDKLKTSGKAADTGNRKKYNKNPKLYESKSIEIKSDIYGDTSVKKVLKKAQNNKCCFCQKDQVDEYGAVEHFRPKHGYQKSKTDILNKPGYYWLGYNWENLFFVCNVCNTSYKGNLFPLLDESKRAKSHNDDISEESPLILDPSGKRDPRKHIYFENNLVSGKTRFGKKTIEVCGLYREDLDILRAKLISDITVRIAVILRRKHHKAVDVEDALNYIRNSKEPGSEFSAVAEDYLLKIKFPLDLL